MSKTVRVTLCLVLVTAALAACAAQATPTATPTAVPTETSEPTATTVPSATPEPTETVEPTATLTMEEAEARETPRVTFAEVGRRVPLTSDHGITGNAIVAGSQTLIIQAFTWGGNCAKPELRLIQAGQPDPPAATLLEIEPRAYERELLRGTIPDGIGPAEANAIAIYCVDTQETLALAVFD